MLGYRRTEWRGSSRPQPELGTYRRGPLWWLRPWACLVGLHVMGWRAANDGYTCACGYQQLHAEDIRR